MPSIVVPELSESVTEAKVGRWLKKEGDRVEAGEAVVELETDKVDLEVGADATGVLAEIVRGDGDSVEVGDELGIIEDSGAEGDEDERAAEVSAAARKEDAGPRAESEGPKEEEGRARETDDFRESSSASLSERAASPSARRLLREHGVELADVARRSSEDRVGKEDVERFLEERDREAGGAEPRKRTRPEEPAGRVNTSADDRLEERVPMSARRKTIARRLVEAQRSSAMLSTFNEVDMTRITELRERERDRFLEEHGVRLGVASFFVRATIGALRRFPRLNAEVQGDEMVLKRYYDIGIAVGDSRGLVVPVIRDADRMSLAGIDKRIKELASRAEDSELTAEDLEGGTFTITNGGVFGSLLSTPILNPPQVGILGLHKIEQRPHVVDGEVAVRPMMYVALSYDHRIVDGLEAVRFLVAVKELVESPERLLLEG